jgi:hypothetical protein
MSNGSNKSGSCVGVLTPPQPEDVSSGLLILFVPRSKLTGYKKNKFSYFCLTLFNFVKAGGIGLAGIHPQGTG